MSANDTQVGGTHYKQSGKPEHWDLVNLYGWDYFQGQVTKYLMRWKTKHTSRERQLEDLQKALHFLQKYLEVEQAKPVEAAEVMRREMLSQSPTKGVYADDQFSVERYLGNGLYVFQDRKTKLEYRVPTLQAAYEMRATQSSSSVPIA
jgi:hypothetical protein